MIHKRKMNNCTTKLSILNINVNPAIIPMIDKYGPQATMLSFAFAFVLFYVSELNNRKKNQNLDNKEIQKKNQKLNTKNKGLNIWKRLILWKVNLQMLIKKLENYKIRRKSKKTYEQ